MVGNIQQTEREVLETNVRKGQPSLTRECLHIVVTPHTTFIFYRQIMQTPDTTKLAVLIDADNTTSSAAKELLAEISKYGISSVKRAYGDWTTTNLRGWKEHLHKHAIQPIQQFSYTSGKNSTDSSMIIDAMDLLYSGSFDGFCIISSDSDFTRLATRIREAGKLVIGIGEKKTPEPFIAACDKFIYLEILKPSEEKEIPPSQNQGDSSSIEELEKILRQAISATSKENNWARLAAAGSYITKNHPEFDPRNYGCKKLGELVRKQKYIESKEETIGSESTNMHIYVKLR